MSALKIRKLTVGGAPVRCPSRGAGSIPRELTLIPSGGIINASCGEMHADATGKRRSRAQCFFQVENLTTAQLHTLTQAQEGKPFRLELKSGNIEGVLVAKGPGAVQSKAARAAAAAAAKSGKAAPAGPAKPAGRATGGSLAAAFGAVAAVAGAVGQTAAAAGQVANAGAAAVSSVSDLGREGIGAARDGIREAGAAGERRHERKMRRAKDADGED
ncbi:hypothetical protein QMK19_33905 [Streptomyces sp. H10-C2]|uniref:hypothetical protein n=1 Tax=unclassified Streptomyces TaxID=2593676 RepID=UPI0024B885EF|nr:MULTISPECIES: hypothetical protein [unclassified Streptomyces]MDJ0345543.1 hypothetical protein [Streptomyces sp. PH10-H1]MDJ0374489.1 hypothetical protein [Streptomyces sp. H10-C2]